MEQDNWKIDIRRGIWPPINSLIPLWRIQLKDKAGYTIHVGYTFHWPEALKAGWIAFKYSNTKIRVGDF